MAAKAYDLGTLAGILKAALAKEINTDSQVLAAERAKKNAEIAGNMAKAASLTAVSLSHGVTRIKVVAKHLTAMSEEFTALHEVLAQDEK